MDPVETRLQRALAHVADSPDVPAPPIADLVRADRRRRRRTTAVVGVTVILIGLLAFTLRKSPAESSLDVVTIPTPGPSTVEAPNRPAPFPSGSAVAKTRFTLGPADLPPIESGINVGFVFPMLVYGNESPGSGPVRLYVDDGTTDREVCPNWSAGADGDCGRNINAGGITRMLWTAPEVTDPAGRTYALHVAMQPADGAPAIVSDRIEVHVKPRGTVTNGTGVQLGGGGGVAMNTFHAADQIFGAIPWHDWAMLDKQLKGSPALLHNERGWADTYGWVDGQFLIVTRADPPVPPATAPTVFHAWLVLNGSVPGDPTATGGQHITECVTLKVSYDANNQYSVEVTDATERQTSAGHISMTEAVDLQNNAC